MPVVQHLPTFSEAGIEGMVVLNWYALVAPLKIPATLAERIATEVRKAMQSPAMMKSLAGEGAEPVGGTPAELGAHIRAEHERWSRVVKAAGITA